MNCALELRQYKNGLTSVENMFVLKLPLFSPPHTRQLEKRGIFRTSMLFTELNPFIYCLGSEASCRFKVHCTASQKRNPVNFKALYPPIFQFLFHTEIFEFLINPLKYINTLFQASFETFCAQIDQLLVFIFKHLKRSINPNLIGQIVLKTKRKALKFGIA